MWSRAAQLCRLRLCCTIHACRVPEALMLRVCLDPRVLKVVENRSIGALTQELFVETLQASARFMWRQSTQHHDLEKAASRSVYCMPLLIGATARQATMKQQKAAVNFESHCGPLPRQQRSQWCWSEVHESVIVRKRPHLHVPYNHHNCRQPAALYDVISYMGAAVVRSWSARW